MTRVEMPKANENLAEATLDRWIVKENDVVAKDQPLCDIITDKAKFELPSPASGTIRKIFATERTLLPVNYVLCLIGDPAEALPTETESANAALVQAHRGTVTQTPTSGSVISLENASAVRATPAARRLAKERGVDLAAVAKSLNLSAPVTEKDIRKFLGD